MDLSVFLILLFVTLQFIAEYYDWSQYKVKLGTFIATLIITLPNIIFMVIDWWQSPHSKIALLVLNTFKPILRGETYRLFRWLKSVGIGLTSDDLNYLPISNPQNSSDFFMTKECFDQASKSAVWKALPEDVDDVSEGDFPFMESTRCTAFIMAYENETVFIHECRLSRKLGDVWSKSNHKDFLSDSSFKSSLIRTRTYTNVDVPTAKLVKSRLARICSSQMPILEKFEWRREWMYFHAVPTLDYLDKDLVFIQAEGDTTAVG